MNQCFNLQLSPGCLLPCNGTTPTIIRTCRQRIPTNKSQKSITIANIINDEITTNTKQWHTITYKYTNNKDRSENKCVHG